MSNVVNIVELQNVVTSVTGSGDINTLRTDVTNIQKMVDFTSKTIFTNVISRYDQSPIIIKDPVSFLSSISVKGSITLNGLVVSGGKGQGVDTFAASTGAVVVYNSSTSTTLYTNTLFIPDESTVLVSADLIPSQSLKYNLGSPEAYWNSLFVGTGSIHVGPTGTIGYSTNAVTVGPALRTNRVELEYANSTVGIYVDENGLQIQQPSGMTGILGATGSTGPTGAVIYSAVVFDAGNAFTNYETYTAPAFDCGGAT